MPIIFFLFRIIVIDKDNIAEHCRSLKQCIFLTLFFSCDPYVCCMMISCTQTAFVMLCNVQPCQQVCVAIQSAAMATCLCRHTMCSHGNVIVSLYNRQLWQRVYVVIQHAAMATGEIRKAEKCACADNQPFSFNHEILQSLLVVMNVRLLCSVVVYCVERPE